MDLLKEGGLLEGLGSVAADRLGFADTASRAASWFLRYSALEAFTINSLAGI